MPEVVPEVVPCDNFLYGFKGARLRLPPGRAETARGSELEARGAWERGRETERVNDHQGQGLSGKGRGRSAPEASAKTAPSRVWTLPGAAADAGPLSRFPRAGGCSPLRGFRHRT